MKYTRQDVLDKAAMVRRKYMRGLLTPSEITFYESLKGWVWDGNAGHRTSAEWVIYAKRLAKQHKGVLPAASWLRSHGHTGLPQCMYDHPDLFKGIKQDKKTRTPAEWVIFAKKLAKQHKGVLPCSSWLRKNGHEGLDACMKGHRPLFTDIKQDKKTRTSAEWVIFAKQLAKQHDDVLPAMGWLMKHHSGLPRCMYDHPDLFKGIKQLRMTPRGQSRIVTL
jgi:hypothetical protein